MLLQIFSLFKSVGILFSIGCLVYLFVGKDAVLKQWLLLPFFVVSSVQVVGTAYFTQGLIVSLVIAAIAVFVSQLFMRTLKICQPCGRIVNDYQGNVPEACPSCNASVVRNGAASVSL